MAFCQQCTGIEAAVYYTPEVLESVGIKDENWLLLATVGVGVVKVAFIVVAASFVDECGRVPLLVLSNLGIALSHGLLALNFACGGVIWLAVLAQCLFMASFSIGAGPCSMMVAAELLPRHLRASGLGVAAFINRVTSGSVALSFLSLQSALTPAGAFTMFCAIALGAAAFVGTAVPETGGQTLEQIELAALGKTTSSSLELSDEGEKGSAGPGMGAAAGGLDSGLLGANVRP